ncbi:4-coumarate--CoA ligase [Gordonia jinhuaensis]|uniref:4-coumarate--CoA ligase n=1 Tax=Gordonia jinhuaensis TaxID=1517702 RepID=A0A916T6T6_9ACTN|nr:4-coumarate--CoA ligase [Gordonia jinhuaensis]
MSFKSPYAEVVIPETTVYDLLFAELSEEDAARPAMIDAWSDTTTNYGELKQQIDAFAGALAARGIGPGDVVALDAPNSTAFAIAFHGILRSGATATTLNALFIGPEVAKQLTASKAKLLVTVNALYPNAIEGAHIAGLDDSDVWVLDGEGLAAGPHANAADILGPAHPAPEIDIDPATHLAVLPYSSGTTGNPKGVMLTHRNLVANVAQIQPLQDTTPDDNIIAILPFFHIYGMTVLLNASLNARATLVVMPRFDLPEFLGNIEKYGVTYGFIAPPVAVALAKHPIVDNYDLSSLRTVMSGAAPLDSELGEAVAKRLNLVMMQGYGMSELSPVSHCMTRDRGQALFGVTAPLDSSGWPVPNSENRIVDPATGDDIEIPAEGLSEPGELWVKGPNVMAGYLDNPDATKTTIDDDGYLHTGDLAQVDSNGCVYIVDRLKEAARRTRGAALDAPRYRRCRRDRRQRR